MEDVTNNIEGIAENSDVYIDMAIEYGITLIGAIFVFIVGRWVAKFLTNLLRKALNKGEVDETLITFLCNLSYAALLTFVVISAIGTLGVNTASFAAVIAAAGLAIGLALQGSLSNFAAGVMIIAFKPFKKGEFVEVAGVSGVVQEVAIFTTTMTTGDNKLVIIPNKGVTDANIVNYSRQKTRRVDMVFGIDYGDDIKLAKETLEKLANEDDRILKDPAVKIAVSELGDNSVNIVCRPWVKTDDFWAVKFDFTENAKVKFDEVGLSFPFPQRDVHLYNEDK